MAVSDKLHDLVEVDEASASRQQEGSPKAPHHQPPLHHSQGGDPDRGGGSDVAEPQQHLNPDTAHQAGDDAVIMPSTESDVPSSTPRQNRPSGLASFFHDPTQPSQSTVRSVEVGSSAQHATIQHETLAA